MKTNDTPADFPVKSEKPRCRIGWNSALFEGCNLPSSWCDLQCLHFQQFIAPLKVSPHQNAPLSLLLQSPSCSMMRLNSKPLSRLKIFFFFSLPFRTVQPAPPLSISITLPISSHPQSISLTLKDHFLFFFPLWCSLFPPNLFFFFFSFSGCVFCQHSFTGCQSLPLMVHFPSSFRLLSSVSSQSNSLTLIFLFWLNFLFPCIHQAATHISFSKMVPSFQRCSFLSRFSDHTFLFFSIPLIPITS